MGQTHTILYAGSHEKLSDCSKGGKISFAEFMQTKSQIDDLMLPFTVYLSQHNQINNKIPIEHIDRIGVVIYRKNIGNMQVTAEQTVQMKK